MKPKPIEKRISSTALANAAMDKLADISDLRPHYPICRPMLPPGVVPQGVRAPVLANDSTPYGSAYNLSAQLFSNNSAGFPGYAILSELALRAEYRAFANAYSTEITREWITLQSTEDDDDQSAERIVQLTKAIEDIKLKSAIQLAAQHDNYFGRGQILLDFYGQDRAKPLVVSKKTITRSDDPRTVFRLANVEPIWTTPKTYNALDPADPFFYNPPEWFLMGQVVNSKRIATVVTRPVPDILKPAFNFSGISMTQLAQPYVNNWLRTRQAVSDLINNFSITVLATAMGDILQGGTGQQLFSRVDIFNLTKSNRGTMVIDKDKEDIKNVSTSLAGLDELQAQAQEHMCSVSRMPAIILTGISPSGLNASSDGEIRVFYDWIAAQQEAFWRDPIKKIIDVLQIILWGEIDPNISFVFEPLYQMTPKELAEIRKSNADAANAYIQNGVLSPEDERARLARDPQSGYQGIEVDDLPEMESTDEDEDQNNEE